MSYEDMADFQRREEMGEDYTPRPLAFTGADLEEMFGPNGPDEDGLAALDLAMDRDMRDRLRHAEDQVAYWRERALQAEGEE